MNFKKLSTLVGLSTLWLMSSAAYANWQGNFLLGFEGGYGSRDAQFNQYIVDTPPMGTAEYTRDHDDDGFLWGVVGGYQVKCDRFLLGLEGNVSWQDFGERQSYSVLDPTPDLWNIGAEHERGAVVGLTARVGFQINSWMMPYLRAGAETSNEKIIFIASNVTQGTAFSLEDERRSYRFVGGAGVEFPVIHQLLLRLEYKYSARGKGAKAQGQMPGSFEVVKVDIKPHQHTGLLALVWNLK